MSERSLGDPVDEPTPELDPATYDVAEFAGGIRPGRRRVTIEPRPDLYPNLQRLIDEINAAPDDADVDDLIDRFEALQRVMRVEWVLERRSREWVVGFYREAAKEMGLDEDLAGGAKDIARGQFTDEQAQEVALRIILAQTVSTSDGVDWDLDRLRQLLAAAPEQVDLLSDAVSRVNAGHAEALTLDFSRRRSTNRATRRSSTS